MLLLVQDLEFLALNWLMLFFPLFRGRFFVIHYQIQYSFPSTITAVRELHWSIVTNKNLDFQFCLTKNFMKTLICFCLLFGWLQISLAQTYLVPGAQIQPAWVMPLWFENGDGQRDTLYFCYDDSAGYPSDTLFGVIAYKENPDSFNMTFAISVYNDSIHQKVAVGNNNLPYQSIGILPQNPSLPLVLRWDPSLFYSDSLPFPDQDPAPRAEGHLFYDLPTQVDGCTYSQPIIMTDSVVSPTFTCYLNDSIVFEGVGASYLTFSVHPWTGMYLGFPQVHNMDELKLYPNPAYNNITIELPEHLPSADLFLYDVYGRNLMQQSLSEYVTELNISHLIPAMYLIVIRSNTQLSYSQVIFKL
jgi:hypothetical protein